MATVFERCIYEIGTMENLYARATGIFHDS